MRSDGTLTSTSDPRHEQRQLSADKSNAAQDSAHVEDLLYASLRASLYRWWQNTPFEMAFFLTAAWALGAVRTGLVFAALIAVGSTIHLAAYRSDRFLRSGRLAPTYLLFALLTALVPLVAMPESTDGQVALLVTTIVAMPIIASSLTAHRQLSTGWALVSGAANALTWTLADTELAQFVPAALIVGFSLMSIGVSWDGATQQRSFAEASARATRVSRHDKLTGLCRRAAFMNAVDRALHDGGGSVIFLDIDRFKVINDTLGHQAGDELLAAAAGRVGTALRGVDFAGRMGGDEIAVFTHNASLDEAARLAERLQDVFVADFRLLNQRVPISVSIGVACANASATTATALVNNADLAMYQAKRSRLGIAHFDEKMRAERVRLEEVELKLRAALANNEIRAHLQPIVNLRRGNILGFEALGRWERHDGTLSPGDFLPSAQQSGLLPLITRSVGSDLVALTNVIPDDAPWLGINVEVADLDSFLDWLEQQPVDPSRWVVELTEHEIVGSYEEAKNAVIRAEQLGIGVVLDDFGDGYSSLARILELPIRAIKIDQRFVAEMLDNPTARAIISASVHLASECQLHVIAEGVETQEQVHELQAIGVNLMQGFFFQRPASIRDMMPLIDNPHVVPIAGCPTPTVSLSLDLTTSTDPDQPDSYIDSDLSVSPNPDTASEIILLTGSTESIRPAT